MLDVVVKIFKTRYVPSKLPQHHRRHPINVQRSFKYERVSTVVNGTGNRMNNCEQFRVNLPEELYTKDEIVCIQTLYLYAARARVDIYTYTHIYTRVYIYR